MLIWQDYLDRDYGFIKKRRITARNLGLVIPVLDAGYVHQTVLWEI